eukprot:GHVL01035866.1.p1 GENE.GHVL01035866.1~~GHVL01035866.1.p1  ORF type:complete len:469 (-),score=46.33 GHVL01035866.1:38-1444(-)
METDGLIDENENVQAIPVMSDEGDEDYNDQATPLHFSATCRSSRHTIADETPEQAVAHSMSLMTREQMENKKGTIGGAISTFGNACMGLAVLNLPQCAVNTGIVLYGVMMLVIGASSALALHLYLEVACRANELEPREEVSYYSVSNLTIPKLKLVVDTCLFIIMFLLLICTLLVTGTLSIDLLGNPWKVSSERFNQVIWQTVFLVAIMIPLTVTPIMQKFASIANWMGIGGVLYASMLVVYKSITAKERKTPKKFSTDFLSVMAAYPVFATAVCCHQVSFSVYNSLSDENRTPKKLNVICAVSMVVPIALNLAVGIFGAVHYDQDVMENIMDNYSAKEIAVAIGKVGLLITMLTTYPLLFHPAKTTLTTLTSSFLGGMNQKLLSIIFTVLLLASTWILSCVIESLGLILGILSWATIMPMMYILPGIFYLKLYSEKSWRTYLSYVVVGSTLIVIPISAVASIKQSFF